MNQLKNVEVIITISNECNNRQLGRSVGRHEGLTLNYSNNSNHISFYTETQENLEIVCLQIKGKILFDIVSELSVQRKKELKECIQWIVYERYDDIVSDLDAMKYPGLENKFALISLKKYSLLYNNELGSETNKTPEETKSKEKPSIIAIIFGFLLVGIGAFGIISWIIIFYIRFKNLKLRREVENKRTLNVAPTVIQDHHQQQDSNNCKKVFQLDCNCCNTSAKRGYDQAPSSKGDEDSFFLKLQAAATSPNDADSNISTHVLPSNQSKNSIHNDTIKGENRTFGEDKFFITSIEPSSGKSSFDNISTDFVKSWKKEPSSSQQNLSSQVRSISMPEHNVSKNHVRWGKSEHISTSAQSNVETMLISDPSFEDNDLLEEDVNSIEVSVSERNFPNLQNLKNDWMEEERESENGFLVYESEKSEKENYISKDEYDAAVSAAEEVLRQTDFFAKRISSLKQDYGDSDVSVNDESTSSVNDEYSRRGDLSLLEAFNELRDVSRFVQKYEQMKINETKGNANNTNKTKGDQIGMKISVDKESHFDIGSDVSNQERKDKVVSKNEITDVEYNLALERALHVIQTHKMWKRETLNQNAKTIQNKSNNDQIKHIDPEETMDLRISKSIKKEETRTDNNEQQSDTSDVGMVNFPSMFAKRLGIKPYVSKTESRLNQLNGNKSDSKVVMTKQENILRIDYADAKKNVNKMPISVEPSVADVEYNSNLNDSTERSSVSEKLVAPSSIQFSPKLRRSKTSKLASKETKKKLIVNLHDSVQTSDQIESTSRLTSESLASFESAQIENESKNTAGVSDGGSSTGAKSLITMFESQRSRTSKALYPQNIHWQYGQIAKEKKSFVSRHTKSTR